MSKRSYDYEVKGDTRTCLRNFIKNNLGSPKTLEVLCLPGAEARDIYEIYAPLGLPRQNITGLEMNPQTLERLEKAQLGINLVGSKDLDFFRTTDKKFDVISLDYFQQFNSAAMEALATVFSRQLLKPLAVLHTNFYGRRESNSVQANYSSAVESMLDVHSVMAKTLLGSASSAANKGIIPLEALRNQEAFTLDALESLDIVRARVNDASVRNTRNSLPDAISLLALAGRKASPDLRSVMTEMSKGAGKKATELSEVWPLFKDLSKAAKELFAADREDDIDKDLYLRKFFAEGGSDFLHCKQNWPYYLTLHKSYSYISDDGSPMLTDIFLFDQKRAWFDEKRWPNPIELRPIIEQQGYTPRVKACIGQYRRVMEEYGNTAKAIQDRMNLGTAYKPKLSAQKAYDLLEQGVSDEQIRKQFRVTQGQLSAFKAWRTMRNKKPSEQSISITEEVQKQ